MKATTLTLTITIRPSYGEPKHVKPEIEESLEWMGPSEHNAIRIEWGPEGEGEWPDREEIDDEE